MNFIHDIALTLLLSYKSSQLGNEAYICDVPSCYYLCCMILFGITSPDDTTHNSSQFATMIPYTHREQYVRSHTNFDCLGFLVGFLHKTKQPLLILAPPSSPLFYYIIIIKKVLLLERADVMPLFIQQGASQPMTMGPLWFILP